jgi:hypothetical protein
MPWLFYGYVKICSIVKITNVNSTHTCNVFSQENNIYSADINLVLPSRYSEGEIPTRLLNILVK